MPGNDEFAIEPQDAYADYGEDVNQLRAKGKSRHCQALIATLLLLGGVATGVVLYMQEQLELGVMLGIIGGGYALYLIIACCCNPLQKYLGNIDRGESFEPYTERVREMVGRFEFYAECYHYETRHHTRTVRDANGNSRTEHYTTRERVVTHRATEYLTPLRTIDESGRADRIRAEANIVFIHFMVRYRFDTVLSNRNFEMHFQNFKMRHTRDAHQDFKMKYEVPGLVPRKAFFVGELQCSYNTWYYLCGMVGMMWPYSMWLESKIERFEINNMKVLTV